MTVVIPALNEASDLPACLRAIAEQRYPRELVEVILVDGCSNDGTPEIALREAAGLDLHINILQNPDRRTTFALNAALAVARGDVLVRVDARSRIPEHYLPTCVTVLDNRPEVGVVGGAQVAAARSDALVERSIARALRNRWATGLSRYRRSSSSGAADTVWMGVFRTAELRRLGGWNERYGINEDFELNQRYREAGKVVWYEASLRSAYLPRKTFRELARQYFAYGTAKGTWWARRKQRPSPRQIALLAVPPIGVTFLGVTAHRWNWRTATAIAGGAAVAVDAVGGSGSPSAPERVMASAATVTVCGAWWLGVLAGYAAEFTSRGGPAPSRMNGWRPPGDFQLRGRRAFR